MKFHKAVTEARQVIKTRNKVITKIKGYISDTARDRMSYKFVSSSVDVDTENKVTVTVKFTDFRFVWYSYTGYVTFERISQDPYDYDLFDFYKYADLFKDIIDHIVTNDWEI